MDIGALAVLMGVLVFAAHFFSWLFSHTRIPAPLLLMLVGVLLGPGFGVLSPEFLGDAGDLLVTVVLVGVLFQSGLGLRFSALMEAWRSTVLLSIVSFVLMMGLVGAVLWLLFSVPPLVSFMVGSIVGGTSSAVVIPMLKQLSINEEAKVTLTLESVVSDVLTIVITIALLQAYQTGTFLLAAVTWKIFISFLGAMVIGVIAALAWSRVLTVVRHMKHSIFTTPALVFIVYGITEALGMSGPISALAFGVVLGNIKQLNSHLEKNHLFLRYLFMAHSLTKRERLFFGEVVFLLQTYFFVFVGVSVQLQSLASVVLAIGLVILMALARILVVRVVVPRDTARDDAAVMAAMVPKGLAAAALAALPLQQGIPGGAFIQETTYGVVLFSVILTSILVFIVSHDGLSKGYLSLLSGFRDGKPEFSGASERY